MHMPFHHHRRRTSKSEERASDGVGFARHAVIVSRDWLAHSPPPP